MSSVILYAATIAFINGNPHPMEEDRTTMRNIGECRNAMELATRNMHSNERFRKEKRLNSVVYIDNLRNVAFVLSCTER